MLQRIASSLKYRAKWARLGVLYVRRPQTRRIRVGGRNVCLVFPDAERSRQEHEFHKIVLEDCYRLNDIPSASTVLDIGANIGIFAIAARHRFPRATIHCYEPNSAVLPNLRSHASQIEATCFSEAVGLKAGKISLQTSEDGSLFSVSKEDAAGLVDQCSFSSAVAKLGRVTLLKLDCEGAEWQIFEDREAWKFVDRLVMEYHLWAKELSSVSELRKVLTSLGFSRINIREDAPSFGMAFADKVDRHEARTPKAEGAALSRSGLRPRSEADTRTECALSGVPQRWYAGSMSPKQFLHALVRQAGFELRRIGAPAAPFIPYLRHYDLDYGAERPCSFDFWISNKDASQWYDEWFFAADDPVWELHQFCKLVRPGDHVLEIGCHHGFLTMQLAHLVGPSGSIVALDANPENVIIAQSNVALNKLANVDILFAAGGERGGSGMFEWKTNSHQVTGAPSTSSYRAEIVTADSLAERFKRDFDVLKLDVEGFECEVLRGAKTVLQSRPNLFLEVHPNEMREWKADGSIPELFKLIHADEYDGTIVCRPDFGKVVPFSQTAVPLDAVSNLHLRSNSRRANAGT